MSQVRRAENHRRTVRLRAFAKVNYSLDVLERRADGYHEVRTVLQTISLADEVHLELTNSAGIELSVTDPTLPTGSENLAWRAAHCFLREVGLANVGVRIRLSKHIPVQAGLGGGSSDAATVLRGLNLLLGNGLTHDRLARVAAQLGSDVPFFLAGGTALMEGRGEIYTRLPDSPFLPLVVVKPEAGVSTAQAYAALDALPGRTTAGGTDPVIRALSASQRKGLLAAMANDFEAVLASLCPEAIHVMEDLSRAGAETVHLCGSGSAVFGAWPSIEEAERVAESLRLRWPVVFQCSTVSAEEVDAA